MNILTASDDLFRNLLNLLLFLLGGDGPLQSDHSMPGDDLGVVGGGGKRFVCNDLLANLAGKCDIGFPVALLICRVTVVFILGRIIRVRL